MTVLLILFGLFITGCGLNNTPNSKVEELLAKYQSLDESIVITPNSLVNGNNLNDDMQNEYEKIDVIVCPSRIDPMPVVVSEGMMHKKLCILSDRVGNAKYVEDGYNAFVCRAGSAESLAEKMSFIINNRGKLDEIRNQGYLVFKKYFAMDKFNNNVKELIKKICEEER